MVTNASHVHMSLILQLSQVQQTRCRSETHKVIFYLGGESFEYKYKACINRKSATVNY